MKMHVGGHHAHSSSTDVVQLLKSRRESACAYAHQHPCELIGFSMRVAQVCCGAGVNEHARTRQH